MKNYSVKEVAEILNTSEETVRRWIRDGKLAANKSSNKAGNQISESMLDAFLKSNKKYAGIAAASTTANLVVGGALLSAVLLGNIVAHNEKNKNSHVTSRELIRVIEQMILKTEKSVAEKRSAIEKLEKEIAEENNNIEKYKEQIIELKKQIENE